MTVRRPFTLALVAIALSLGGFVESASATAITIVNGSFELTTGSDPGAFTTKGTGDTSITGWTVSSGSIDYIGTYWQPGDGARSLDMNGIATGEIQQIILVPHAGNVSIKFAMAGNPDAGPTVKNLRVSLVSTTFSQSFTFDITGKTHASMGWLDMEALFLGVAGGSYTLSFASLDGGSWGPALDKVSASVPDGGMTASLLGIALTGLAYFRRKRV